MSSGQTEIDECADKLMDLTEAYKINPLDDTKMEMILLIHHIRYLQSKDD